MKVGTFLAGALLAALGLGLAEAIYGQQLSPGFVPLALLSLIGGALLCIASAAAMFGAGFVRWMQRAPR